MTTRSKPLIVRRRAPRWRERRDVGRGREPLDGRVRVGERRPARRRQTRFEFEDRAVAVEPVDGEFDVDGFTVPGEVEFVRVGRGRRRSAQLGHEVLGAGGVQQRRDRRSAQVEGRDAQQGLGIFADRLDSERRVADDGQNAVGLNRLRRDEVALHAWGRNRRANGLLHAHNGRWTHRSIIALVTQSSSVMSLQMGWWAVQPLAQFFASSAAVAASRDATERLIAAPIAALSPVPTAASRSGNGSPAPAVP